MQVDTATGKAQPQEGVGVVVGVFLSEDQRPQIRVLDGKQMWNIDLPAINATLEGKERYYAHISAIYAHSDSVNEKIKKMANAGNEVIKTLNNEYLGYPIKLEIDEESKDA